MLFGSPLSFSKVNWLVVERLPSDLVQDRLDVLDLAPSSR